jgi:galactose-1-phosphate uridylyltransferase
MQPISFVERVLDASVPDFDNGGAFKDVPIIFRIDPLLGLSCRIISGEKLQPTEPADVGPLRERRGFCPFCADTIDEATAPFPTEVIEEGKVREGRCVVVPNVLAYSSYSAVGVYDPSRHFLGMGDFDASLVGDALWAMVRHAQAVSRHDQSMTYFSINANYMPSSGSSLVHAHLQSSCDAVPLSMQRLRGEASRRFLLAQGRPYGEVLIETEREGPRWIGETGPVAWLTPFAPTGFHEVWGYIQGVRDIPQLDEPTTRCLGQGVAKILGAYAGAHLSAFNFSLQGGGPEASENGTELLFRVVSRAPIEPYYRSEITYFERLGLEAMIDQSPESWAHAVRTRF